MKINGKIKDLKRILEKVSCGGTFDPISIKITPEKVIAKMLHPKMTVGVLASFTGLETDVEDGQVINLYAQDLLEALSPNSPNSDFEATLKEGNLIIDVEGEIINYRLQENWESDENFRETINFGINDEGRVKLKTGILETKINIDSQKLREVETRKKVVGVSFVTIQEESGGIKWIVGDLNSTSRHPRVFPTDGKVEYGEGKGNKTTVAEGFKSITKQLEGDVDLHFSTQQPLIIHDEGENYKTIYLLTPFMEQTVGE